MILSFKSCRFGDLKKLMMGILPIKAWWFGDFHVEILEIWWFSVACVDGDFRGKVCRSEDTDPPPLQTCTPQCNAILSWFWTNLFNLLTTNSIFDMDTCSLFSFLWMATSNLGLPIHSSLASYCAEANTYLSKGLALRTITILLGPPFTGLFCLRVYSP